MKKLKIILLFKKRNILFIFLFLYVFTFTIIIKYESNYNNESTIYGQVIDYVIKDNKIQLVIKGKEKIMANYYFKNPQEISNIKYGSYIKVVGKMKKPNNNTVSNVFNYKKYLYNLRIYNCFEVEKYEVTNNLNNLYKLKNAFYERSKKLASQKYVNTLFLGNKSFLDEEEIIAIKQNGIMHLFAVSGLHISFLVSTIDQLLKKLNKYLKKSLIIILMMIYAFIVGFPPSILRVIICFIIKFIYDILNYKTSNLEVLFISAFIILLINPFYVYDLGFIYSYTMMFFIFLFSAKKKTNNIMFSLKFSFLMFMVSTPITIYNFYKINLLSILINIVAIPLVSYLIFPLTVLTFCFPVLDHFLFIIFKSFLNINIALNKIDLLNICIAKPSIILIALFYVCLFYFYKHHKILYLTIICLLIYLNNFANYNYKLYFMDVGQGDSTLIISPFNKKVIMIDTGGKMFAFKPFYTKNTITYLNSMGINKINFLIITHGDYDHMGEAINLVNNFKVEKVIFNCGEYNDLEKDLIKVLNKKKIEYYSCIKELNIDNNKLYFLQTKEYDNENDNSNVIYTELNGYKFMFMGDASTTTEKEILSKYNLSDVDVLKVGHHGSKTSSSKEFIDEIKPKYSVISVGKNNRYGHPNKEVLDTLDNSKVYRTDQDGSIMFKIKNNKLQIETCSP